MKRPRVRRLLDLTPLLDVIMILLFGAMIHSVELSKIAVKRAHADEPPRSARDLAADQAVARRNAIEKVALSELVARLIGLSDRERTALLDRLRALAEAPPEKTAELIEEMRKGESDPAIALAIKRIEEMQKVFTFIDLHIDSADFLIVESDGKRLDRFSIRDRAAGDISAAIKRSLQSLQFNDVVLVMFSYDGDARDRSVETTESAVNQTLEAFRRDSSLGAKQYRLGRVGLLPGGNE